jgi:ABC-type branched-subunit amino acid transport system ATPase component
LTKHYGRIAAVDGVDLTVRAGDIYGFLGPNGSGALAPPCAVFRRRDVTGD